MGHGGTGPRRRLDLHLVRCERHAANFDRAVGLDLETVLVGGGHDGRDSGAELPADLRQERLDAPIHELRLVADQLDGLDVDLVPHEVQQGIELDESIPAGHCQPHSTQRLAHLDAGLTSESASEVDYAHGDFHRSLECPIVETVKLFSRPARQMDAVRYGVRSY